MTVTANELSAIDKEILNFNTDDVKDMIRARKLEQAPKTLDMDTYSKIVQHIKDRFPEFDNYVHRCVYITLNEKELGDASWKIHSVCKQLEANGFFTYLHTENRKFPMETVLFIYLTEHDRERHIGTLQQLPSPPNFVHGGYTLHNPGMPHGVQFRNTGPHIPQLPPQFDPMNNDMYRRLAGLPVTHDEFDQSMRDAIVNIIPNYLQQLLESMNGMEEVIKNSPLNK